MERRNFIKLSALSGGGMMLSTLLPVNQLLASELNGNWEPNLHVRISPDNQITMISTQYEIGQGTTTGMAQILADELGVDLKKLQIELAPGDPKKYGLWHGSGGSSGLASNWMPLRKAGAATREVLIQAAAAQWKVATSECSVDDGHVVHSKSGKQSTFGELSSAAAKLSLPENPKLKPASEFKYIGKSLAGTKQTKIVTGTTPYSLDMSLPDMVYATIERTPVFGGKVKSFDDSEAKKVKGVIEIYSYEGLPQSQENGYWGGVRAGVVVVANSTWSSIKARKALNIEWDLGPNASLGNSDLTESMLTVLGSSRERTTTVGDPDGHLKAATDKNHFQYLNGLQSNICMEPLNAIADVKSDRADIWVGTQAPGIEHVRIASILDLPEDKVTVNAKPSGGGFGRRFFADYTEEAALISRKVGKPVKLMWTREDTVRTNRYHDQYLQDWTGVLDENKQLLAVDYQGHLRGVSPYRALTYSFPNFGMTPLRPNIRINGHVSWRSVAAHQWILGLESFMDEMAHIAQVDPLDFRVNHLKDEDIVKQKNDSTLEDLYPARLKECLKVAAEKSKWGKKSKRNHGQGISGASYNASYCAVVADVEVNNGKLTIHKMTAAIDCGLTINPSQVKAQIEGGIVWGLGALFTEITIKNGKTEQSNYHDYPIIKMTDMPEIEVHIVKSDYAPTGTGEPSVPITAPAVLNAIFAATGKRLRNIPIDMKELT